MLLYIFLGDGDIGLHFFQLLIDLNNNLLVLLAEFPVDAVQGPIYVAQLAYYLLFFLPEPEEAVVELFFLVEQVLVVEEQMLFLSAHVEALVLWHYVIGRTF